MKLLDEGYDVLSIHISSKLSGTMDSAIQAKEMLPGKPIEVVDSLSAGMATGFQVLTAARASVAGATLKECKYLAEKAHRTMRCVFGGRFARIFTPRWAYRGGAAFLGTALNLKPILELRGGRIEAVEKVRSMNRAIDRMLELFEKRINQRHPIRFQDCSPITHQMPNYYWSVLGSVLGVSDVAEAVSAPVSPVIGVHIGPGALGLCFMAGM